MQTTILRSRETKLNVSYTLMEATLKKKDSMVGALSLLLKGSPFILNTGQGTTNLIYHKDKLEEKLLRFSKRWIMRSIKGLRRLKSVTTTKVLKNG